MLQWTVGLGTQGGEMKSKTKSLGQVAWEVLHPSCCPWNNMSKTLKARWSKIGDAVEREVLRRQKRKGP